MNIPNTADNNGNSNPMGLLNVLLNIYDKVMVLKVFVDSDYHRLRDMYLNAALAHNNKLLTNPSHIDAGFDLFAPGSGQYVLDSIEFFGPGWPGKSPVNKLDLKICCAARIHADTVKSFNTGYYMHPRSSLSKTQLRLANSTGIVDAGYRGHLIGMFDVVNIPPNPTQPPNRASDYSGIKYDRYLQICAPGLVPIMVEIVDLLSDLGDETERGAGGFGSTGR
jgi:dUTP pyrophosphatase